jgi:hypothetical protein
VPRKEQRQEQQQEPRRKQRLRQWRRRPVEGMERRRQRRRRPVEGMERRRVWIVLGEEEEERWWRLLEVLAVVWRTRMLVRLLDGLLAPLRREVSVPLIV